LRTLYNYEVAYRVRKIAPAVLACGKGSALDFAHPTLLSVVCLILLHAGAALAQEASPNLASKTVTIYVGYGPGGGYDLYARTLARHFGKHIPGRPAVVVSNMPGAASIRAANYVYAVAPRDATALGIVAQSIAEEQLLGTPGVSYDVARFNWIGRFASNVEVSYVWHTTPVKTVNDLKTTEATFAGTGPSSSVYPRLLNSMLGMKWKVVAGYGTTAAAHLAMQRREVDGATSSLSTLKTTQPGWLERKLIRILVQLSRQRSRELADIPAVVELGRTQEDKDLLAFYAASGAVGRAVIAPADVPSDRIAMLRSAFSATMKDPDFLADIAATRLELEPLAGTELQALVEASTKVSETVLQRARAARAE
jgi:tripartite-type tricarboxylate transporter receptor subunit TctC